MQSRHISLSSIMSLWKGEDVRLISKGIKMIAVIEDRQLLIERHENINNNGVNLFSEISRNNHLFQRENYGYQKFAQSQKEFVVKANSRSPHRVSLADLGQIYNYAKIEQNMAARKRRASQHFHSPKKFDCLHPLKQNNNEHYPGQVQQNNNQWPLRNYFTVQQGHGERKQIQENKQQNMIKPSSPSYLRNKIRNMIINKKQIISQKHEKKKQIENEKIDIQYQNANKKFENIKQQILQKIIKQGQRNQMQVILKQIREAANQIISKYKVPQKQIINHKNTFSFTDHLLEQNNKIEINKQQSIGNKKSQCHDNLPKFKDDTGSISSILSNNGQKKDQFDSKDEDFCKITNVFINDANHIINNKQVELNNRSLGVNKQKGEQVLKCDHKNSSVEEQKFISLRKVNKSQQCEGIENLSKVQEKNKQKNESDKNLIQTYPEYQLERLTAQPVRIINNLEQAKMFDPEVVKYTELKVKYIETRTVSPQIIRIPSPLRFRRKQEVIKHLVANNVVGKQSASIQF